MKAFRKNSFRGRLFNVVSQLLILAFSFLVCLWMISGAKAVETNNLTDIKTNGDDNIRTVEIIFKGEIKPENVKSNYERDFLQFSVENVTAFPAKTAEIGGAILPRVYAYQYQPNLARARLYISGNIREMQPAISWKVENNKIVIQFDKSKAVPRKSDKPENKINTVLRDRLETTLSSVSKTEEQPQLSQEEEMLLKKMTDRLVDKRETAAASTHPAPAPALAAAAQPAAKTDVKPEPAEKTTEDLFSGMKQDPQRAGANHNPAANFGFGKIIFNLAVVLALIGAMAWGFRKFVLKKGLSMGANSKVIRVLSSYSLSPGKHITVVKVADEYLVLGVAGNNISLISTLDRASGIEKYFGDDSAGNGSIAKSKNLFSGFLGKELESEPTELDDETLGTPIQAPTKESGSPAFSVRDNIKNRVRGFKQLT